MSTTQFIKDRVRGEVGQHFVAEMIRNWGLEVFEVPRGKFDDFDLIVSGKLFDKQIHTTVEVKHDYRLSETGNFYLDIPALRHSRAKILTIVEGNPPHTVYILPLQDALNYALRHPNVIGGEYHETSCLVSKEVFISALKPKILITKQ